MLSILYIIYTIKYFSMLVVHHIIMTLWNFQACQLKNIRVTTLFVSIVEKRICMHNVNAWRTSIDQASSRYLRVTPLIALESRYRGFLQAHKDAKVIDKSFA